MLLKVKLKAFMMAKVEIIEVGIAKALIRVTLRFFKNRRTAIVAKKPP
jgi:hypothetical protein